MFSSDEVFNDGRTFRDGPGRYLLRRKARTRRPRNVRRGGGSLSFDRLEDRQLLSGDLTQSIENLLTNGSTGMVPLTDVTIGGFLHADTVNVTIGDVSHQGADWTASVQLDADIASLGIGSVFSATIQSDDVQKNYGLTGSYTLDHQTIDQGSFALTLGEVDVTAAGLLTGTAHEVSVAYTPSAAPDRRWRTSARSSAISPRSRMPRPH